MNEEIKVFRINECEWWVTRGYAEDLIKWYNENIADTEDNEVELCDLDKEGMWYLTKDKKDIEELGDSDELIGFEIVNGQHKHKVQFGDLMKKYGEVYKFIPFRESIKFNLDFKEPYCIASTEW